MPLSGRGQEQGPPTVAALLAVPASRPTAGPSRARGEGVRKESWPSWPQSPVSPGRGGALAGASDAKPSVTGSGKGVAEGRRCHIGSVTTDWDSHGCTNSPGQRGRGWAGLLGTSQDPPRPSVCVPPAGPGTPQPWEAVHRQGISPPVLPSRQCPGPQGEAGRPGCSGPGCLWAVGAGGWVGRAQPGGPASSALLTCLFFWGCWPCRPLLPAGRCALGTLPLRDD